MAAASFKDLCLDASDARVVGAFWAAALGQELELREDGDSCVQGPNFPTLWVDAVPEPKVVKNRVHLDLRVPDIGALVELGATILAEHPDWTVLGDPEGNELCAFPDDAGIAGEAPARAFAVCVDSAAPVELAAWWQGQIGGDLGPGSDGRPRWLHGARGLDGLILKFVPVDDPRVVKNRSHWDVTVDAAADGTGGVDALLAAGATLVRAQDEEIRWTVLADPQGNEFCAFTTTSSTTTP